MKVIENAALSKYCTFGIGGVASQLVNWEKTSEIKEIVDLAKTTNLKIFFYGGGSNILFPDEGLDAVVVRCQTKTIEIDHNLLVCDAGLSWPLVSRFCIQNKLYGLESFYGLPGTIGGAIVGNAGCHGTETKDVIQQVEIFDLDKEALTIVNLKNKDFGYRESIFKKNPKWVITRAWYKVSRNIEDMAGDPQEFANFRKTRQPQGLTTGSFFKNPYPEHAGALLDKAGLKGFKVGGVSFSDKHANFMLNDGTGTAKDVLTLDSYAKQKVFEEFGVNLEEEVKVISDSSLISLK